MNKSLPIVVGARPCNLTVIADPADPDPDEMLSLIIIADLFVANCVWTAYALRDSSPSCAPTAKWARLAIFAINRSTRQALHQWKHSHRLATSWLRLTKIVIMRHTAQEDAKWTRGWQMIWKCCSKDRKLLDEYYPFGLPCSRNFKCVLCVMWRMGLGGQRKQQRLVATFDNSKSSLCCSVRSHLQTSLHCADGIIGLHCCIFCARELRSPHGVVMHMKQKHPKKFAAYEKDILKLHSLDVASDDEDMASG